MREKDAQYRNLSSTENSSSQKSETFIEKSSDFMAWGNTVVKIIFKDDSYNKIYHSQVDHFFRSLLNDNEEFSICSHSALNKQGTGQQKTTDNEKSNSSFNNIPLYTSAYEDILDGVDEDSEEEEMTEQFSDVKCFNCLGGHHMRECPEKIDGLRVAAHRKELCMNQSTIRYHEDESKKIYKPGILSTVLRTALGLNGDQLPHHVYAMRVIGYPPGWMLEAEFETSGITMYDGMGIALPERCCPGEKTKYDPAKFVDFPGFTSPVPQDMKDEWKEHGMVPFQMEHQLEEIIKIKNTPTCIPQIPETPVPLNNNTQKRKMVLPSPRVNNDSKKVKNENGTNMEDNSLADWSPESNSTPKQTRCETSQLERSFGSSLFASPGTPILPQGNPFDRLPSAGNFSKGITEHLPFENLPDSVGKYEKMREILSSVQKKLRDLKDSS